MNARSQRLCTWSGVVFMVLFFLGFGVIARFIPPPHPSNGPEQVARLYRDHANAIRLGMIVSMYALVFWVPWVAAISVQLKRIEGPHSPFTYAQLALGAGLPVAFFPALYFFSNAAFRSERAPAVVQMLNDQGWLPFTGIVYAIFLQNLVIGAAVFMDRREKPVYPRWFAYFSWWCALLYCPASLDIFFKDGPLAWNGLFSWWLSLVAFFIWLVVTTVMTFRAIASQEAQEQTGAHDSPAALAALEGRIAELRREVSNLDDVVALHRGSCP